MKYPELVRLDKRPEILSVKHVVATEKIHGTNFRVFFPAGLTSIEEIQFGGRNEEFGAGETSFYGGRPVKWFKDQRDLLERMKDTFASYGFSDVTVFGEAFGAGVQKGIKYVADDAVIFRAFDIMVAECFVTYDLFVEICDKAQLPRVPEIWRGEPSLAAFDALLEQASTEGARNGVTVSDDNKNIAEGVVIRSNPLLRDVFGQWLIIKHKSEKFSEIAKGRGSGASSDPTKVRTDMSAATAFAEMFVTRGRIVNAIGRIKDKGTEIKDDMEDMKHLIPAMVTDLHKECMAEWNEALTKGVNEKQVRAEVTKVLGAVYRRMLIESASG